MSNRLKKKDDLKTGFTNCVPGRLFHKMVYKKGFGVRCMYCGKIASDCTGSKENTGIKLD